MFKTLLLILLNITASVQLLAAEIEHSSLDAATKAISLTPSEASVKISATSESVSSSCAVFRYRLKYELIRQEQSKNLIHSISQKKRLSSEDLAALKQLTERGNSKIPGFGQLNQVIETRWPLTFLNQGELVKLQSTLENSKKSIEVADIAWTSQAGFLPDELYLEIDTQSNELVLKALSNSVDVCMGNQSIRLNLELPDGTKIEASAELPVE